MEKFKPKYHIETRHEKTIKFKEGDIRNYQYEQPVEYCNGICYWDYEKDSYERINWGNLYWESKWFNECIKISRYNEKVWTDEKAMDSAFELIFTRKSKGEGVYIPMKDFEIWLMCKGYEMISFDKMCSQSPCISILSSKKEGNKIIDIKGVVYSRFYHNFKTDKTIFFCFGISSDYLKFNFYFKNIENMNLHYQVPIEIKDFEKAENCELKSFEELNYEIIQSLKQQV